MREEAINGIVSGLNLPAAVAQKLFNKYLESLPKDVEQLKENIVNEDFPAAAKTAHSIKGASGNLRITKIFELAGELERVSKAANEGTANEGTKEEANTLLGKIEDLMKTLM